jgi:hypothetical protein
MDFNNYVGKPSYLVEDNIYTLYPGTMNGNILQVDFLLRRHYVETRDDLVQLGQPTYSGFFYKIAS